MIVPEKVRKMTKVEKFHYYLERIASPDTPENAKTEAVNELDTLMKGVAINDVFTVFNVRGTIRIPTCKEGEDDRATLTFISPVSKIPVVISLAILDRDQFIEPVPEAPREIKSFLTDAEKKELSE